MSRAGVAEHRLLISVIVVATTVASGAALTLRTPVYEASAEIAVTPLDTAQAPIGMPVFRDLRDPIRTIETAAALLHTHAASQQTARRLGSPWTPDRVHQAITIRPLGQTNLLTVSARAGTGGDAATLANSYTEVALTLRRQALATAVSAALVSTRANLQSSPRGSAAADTALARAAILEQLRAVGDPSATRSQAAVVPSSPTGLPSPFVLVLSALTGLLAALAVSVLIGAPDARPDPVSDPVRSESRVHLPPARDLLDRTRAAKIDLDKKPARAR